MGLLNSGSSPSDTSVSLNYGEDSGRCLQDIGSRGHWIQSDSKGTDPRTCPRRWNHKALDEAEPGFGFLLPGARWHPCCCWGYPWSPTWNCPAGALKQRGTIPALPDSSMLTQLANWEPVEAWHSHSELQAKVKRSLEKTQNTAQIQAAHVLSVGDIAHRTKALPQLSARVASPGHGGSQF